MKITLLLFTAKIPLSDKQDGFRIPLTMQPVVLVRIDSYLDSTQQILL
jgi:hypothetical protein